MSLKVLRWAWTVCVPPVPKLVLVALSDEADDQGFCYPSQRHLAGKCNMSERSVRRIVALLVEGKHVSIEKRFRTDGSRTSNGYRLAFETPRTNGPGVPDSTDRGERTPLSGGRGHVCPGALDTAVRVTTTYPCIYPKKLLPNDTHEVHDSATVGDRGCDLCFPEGLARVQQEALLKTLAGLAKEQAQLILDELAGRMNTNQVRNPVRYCAALVSRLKHGTFVADVGVRVAEKRRGEQRPRLGRQHQAGPATEIHPKTPPLLQSKQTLLHGIRRPIDVPPTAERSDNDAS